MRPQRKARKRRVQKLRKLCGKYITRLDLILLNKKDRSRKSQLCAGSFLCFRMKTLCQAGTPIKKDVRYGCKDNACSCSGYFRNLTVDDTVCGQFELQVETLFQRSFCLNDGICRGKTGDLCGMRLKLDIFIALYNSIKNRNGWVQLGKLFLVCIKGYVERGTDSVNIIQVEFGRGSFRGNGDF